MAVLKGKDREQFLPSAQGGVVLSPEKIEQFIEDLTEKGRVAGTIEWYRRGLLQLYRALAEDKCIGKETLSLWRQSLLEDGYAARTVNQFMTAANSFLQYCDARDLQIGNQIKVECEAQPNLTRKEYQQLLKTAKELKRERVYLLIKLFACTDLPVQELHKLTVETVHAGTVQTSFNGVVQNTRIPAFLKEEILRYAQREKIGEGPIFLARDGSPMSRVNVSVGIRQLCITAGIAEEKGNPRALKKLYLATRANIEKDVARIVERMYDQMLEQEQSIVGWEE
ncbi:MAG: site-specific integrase [Oscillospiraceae bacterium]|nr:site-specific integrase [Oscillospiraceae bacterium]MBQ3241469.1 site-specific integrase [Oscillospiraceae bacterium]